ncbi:MAG TPA: hypothetical protein VNE39_15375 [Planctomycetota bacterium]|nr:hypothetical protein [Planctomycetota bacterium]
MRTNTTVSHLACLVLMAGGAGCMVRLSPRRVELKRSARPPIYRLGKITEDLTGTWAAAAKTNDWGGKNPVAALLRQSEAASLFSSDPNNLTMDIHLVSSHEDDAPRLAFLALMSICTLGIMPLHYRSEWTSDVTVTIRTPDGATVDEHALRAKGAYDIWAMPLTMFTLGTAALRGPLDGQEVRNRMTRKAAADLMEAAERDYDRLARWRQAWAVIADQQPISVQAGAATYWATYNIAAATEAAGRRREYVLEIHQSRPRRGAAPWRSVVLGDARLAPDAPWRWRDPRDVVLYADQRLWHPEWKVEGLQAQLAAVQFKERPVTAKELFAPDGLSDLSATDWNDLLVAWKNRELVALLREASTADLTGHVSQIEQLVLRANESAEREKDEAQKLIAAGKPGGELHAEAARAYAARIEILKPILAAIKAEVANRQR